MSNARHPIQPFVTDEHGTVRFKDNAIIRYLFSHGKIDLNQIAMMDFTKEDRQQLAQLLGYSLDGYSDLSYVDEAAWAAVCELTLSESLTPNGPPSEQAIVNQHKGDLQ